MGYSFIHVKQVFSGQLFAFLVLVPLAGGAGAAMSAPPCTVRMKAGVVILADTVCDALVNLRQHLHSDAQGNGHGYSSRVSPITPDKVSPILPVHTF